MTTGGAPLRTNVGDVFVAHSFSSFSFVGGSTGESISGCWGGICSLSKCVAPPVAVNEGLGAGQSFKHGLKLAVSGGV